VLPSDAFTQAIIKSTYTLLSPADGEREGLTEEEGEDEADGLKLLEALLEAEALGDREGETDPLGLLEALVLALGDWDELCETEADCEWLVSKSPSSLSACPQERVSFALRISIPLANLKAPRIPLSLNDEIPPSKLLTVYVCIFFRLPYVFISSLVW